jgi:two-component system cell cycle sensor histidine kinase/response regulator CckA
MTGVREHEAEVSTYRKWRKTFLILEDDALIAATLERQLINKAGYEVVGTVASGPEALLLTHATKPDVVLLDIRLNGPMDGIETGKEIQYDLKLPVIYLTAYEDDGTVCRAKGSSVLGYLVKPVQETSLKAALEIAFHLHDIHTTSHRTDAWLNGGIEYLHQGVVTVAPDGTTGSANARADPSLTS